MRLLLIVIITLFSIIGSKAGQWILVDTSKTIEEQIFYRSISCYDSLNCIAFGVWQLNNTWSKITTDGGNTWNFAYRDSVIHTEPSFPHDVQYLDSNLCIAVIDSGYYVISRDRCRTWKRFNLNTKDDLLKISFINENNGFLISIHDVYKTTNGGKDWVKSIINIADSIKPTLTDDIQMIDSNKIYYLGYKSKIGYLLLESDDNGNNWFLKNKFPFTTEYIFFLDSLKGWAIGRKGPVSKTEDYIINTTDGGRNWVVQLDTALKSYVGLNHIYFSDSLNGVAFGTTFRLWKTTNGGKKWALDSIYLKAQLQWYFADVAFFSQENIIGVCESTGYIYKYTNQASSILVNTPKDIFNISLFPNPLPRGTPLKISINLTEPEQAEFKIIDELGREFDGFSTFLDVGKKTLEYSPDSKLPPGMYFLKCNIGGKLLELKPFVILN